jgi:hypothetical protein
MLECTTSLQYAFLTTVLFVLLVICRSAPHPPSIEDFSQGLIRGVGGGGGGGVFLVAGKDLGVLHCHCEQWLPFSQVHYQRQSYPLIAVP